MEIKIGDIVRDGVTGFEGMAVAITEWLHGCKRVTVQPQKLHEGKPIEAVTFDYPQLVVVQAKDHQPLRKTGGPRPEPSRKPSAR
jgi:hypothetical protein